MDKRRLSDSRLANIGACHTCHAFNVYHIEFKAITRRAKARFERQDWHGLHADAVERLDLYKKAVDPVVTRISVLLGGRVHDELVWAGMKAVYSSLIAEREDWELAETFFNSITRRIFATVGVDPQIEFVDTDFDAPPTAAEEPLYRSYSPTTTLEALIETILVNYPFAIPYQDLQRDVRFVAGEIERHLMNGGCGKVGGIEMIKSVFYRNKGAYLIGRLLSDASRVPLAIALMNTPQGIVVDAVLLTEDEISIVFGFVHSYFHVETERPFDLVHFLKTLMPLKRVAELYISIGHHKHGKTELYRDLLHYLASTDDRFEIARGDRGMVMAVFTLPDYDMVFKVIKDRFADPKTTTRQMVMQKYRMVFRHDRAGRLVDAQEFEHLQFNRDRFSEAVLDELLSVASQAVQVKDNRVVVKHAYLQRRVTPLNLYLRETDAAGARAAVVEFGNAIKDLAGNNISPGDFLLKNFGVTRHGRVVFYDYDELCFLTDCMFSAMPQPRNDDEELAGEPWYYVGEREIFPEEFRTFLGLPERLRDVFTEHHGELMSVHFWRQMQARLMAGEVMDIFPYPERKRRSRGG